MPVICHMLCYAIAMVQIKLEIWGRAQREAARWVRKQALINF